VKAAWPGWWSDDAAGSTSASLELRFSVARKLGLDPRSLGEEGQPRFVWRDEGKFKHLSTQNEVERSAIGSFGAAISRALVAGTKPGPSIENLPAQELRKVILASQQFVRLVDLIGLCWGTGIPVIFLRIFPLAAKRMCAMTVRVGDRFAILLGKESKYPAPIAFYIAHELAHAALGHLRDGLAIVDLEDPLEEAAETDEEELAADRYALELLTGQPDPIVTTRARRFTAPQLAANLLQTGAAMRIEPGTLALCFGYSTGQWAKANAAMKRIYADALPAWAEINRTAHQQLDWSAISDDLASFVRAVMGPIDDAHSRH